MSKQFITQIAIINGISLLIICINWYITGIYGTSVQWAAALSGAYITYLIVSKPYKKYYYKVIDNRTCTEVCQLQKHFNNRSIRIGSASCKACKNCVAFCNKTDYIVCKHIEQAIDNKI